MGARLGAKAIDFVTLLVLARFLTPSDFGLVTIAMSLIYIVEAIFELPLEQALVRLDDIRPGHLDTTFTLSALRGAAVMIALVSLAWPFAYFYDDTRLIPLICLLSLAPTARGLLSPRLVLFVKQLDYRRDFVVQLGGKVTALCVASALALSTRSYWSIGAGTVATPLAMVVISYVLAPYRPRASLSQKHVFLKFLGWTSAAQVVTAFSWQCDRLVLGKFASHSMLGAFSMASDLAAMPDQALIKPIARPLISAFVLVRQDLVRLREAYAKATSTALIVGLPFALGLSLLAGPAIELAMGSKWLAAAPNLQWLALAPVPALFVMPLGALAISLDRPDIFLRQSVAGLCIKLPLVTGGIIWFGLPGAIFSLLSASVLITLVSMRFVKRLVGTPFYIQGLGAWRVLVSAAVLTVTLLLVRHSLSGVHDLELLVRCAAVGVCSFGLYVATLFVLWWNAGRPAGLESTVYNSLCSLWYKCRRLGSFG